ncbi:hypothetical protein EDD37DRAFT_466633 [Exophiala viscosa]|uniref:Zinc finger C2H2 LYAR-type domain-containing protein n=1 Tax=Exophiala viscosa TaxID=2486360 RepID=A0AAN6IE60_9EURO|nr:hypothetical protein EDD36DRAFT_219258 [Exophiala viscosa]KAI1622262.1 hypothetical protein EDD37DRAFT_466633 [Exophiala viscosa]
MVSFQCEGCGDVLTKKKLDSHRNQCRAPFTCLDCMTTFQGTSYKSHTSCITEDQKYQGALYREKPSKAAKRKSVSIVEPDNSKALVPRPAYVEDALDVDTPPHAPTPPPAVTDPSQDSVFDYMVDESQPGTPQKSYTVKDKGEMSMKNSAPSIFSESRAPSQNGYRNSEEQSHNQEYEEKGYTWGTEPVKPRGALDMNGSALSLEFMTPAAKEAKSKLDKKERPRVHSRTNSGSEKKRKRPTDDQFHELERDTLMVDTVKADAHGIVHSGLTGGLNRMLTEVDEYPSSRSPDTEDRRRTSDKTHSSRRPQKSEDPTSPLKRTRHTKEDPNGLGISIKGRAVKALSMVGGALLPGSQYDSQQGTNRTRRRASSSDQTSSLVRIREGEKRERKKHKAQRHNGTASANVRQEHKSRHRTDDDGSPSHSQVQGTGRKMKAIEYHKHDDSASDTDSEGTRRTGDKRKGSNGAMVVFGAEEKMKRSCRSFLANAPGMESDKGYSIHKMLKRWHKNNDVRSGSGKAEEEDELWRSLRVRRNEKGQYVVFF